jgi:hypothetical protein
VRNVILSNKWSSTIVTLCINDGGHVEVQMYILFPTITTIKTLNSAYKFSYNEKVKHLHLWFLHLPTAKSGKVNLA